MHRQKVNKTFKVVEQDVNVWRMLTWEICEGFAIIFGPSGLGKSTLLHCLLGVGVSNDWWNPCWRKKFLFNVRRWGAIFRRHRVGKDLSAASWINSMNILENVVFALSLTLDYNAELIDQKGRKLNSLNAGMGNISSTRVKLWTAAESQGLARSCPW